MREFDQRSTQEGIQKNALAFANAEIKSSLKQQGLPKKLS
jgi:hypothetical protein